MRQKSAIFTVVIAVVLLICGVSPLYAASMSPEEATYELLNNNVVKVTLDKDEDFDEYINAIGMNYSSFDGYKHILKYYYYHERPNEYFIQVVVNNGENDIRAAVNQIIDEIKLQAMNASGPVTQMEYINRYLIDHVDYDDKVFKDYLEGRETDSLTPWSAEGALLHGKAVCEGYSGAFMLACDSLGIPCIKVNGVLQGTPHSWNSVYIASIDDWLNVDVTNNDPGRVEVDPSYYSRLFLLTDTQFESYGYKWDTQQSTALRDMRFPYLVVKQLDHLRSLGLIVGRGGGDFATSSNLTRQELAALLTRLYDADLSQEPSATTLQDVDPWARQAVFWCKENNYMVGFPDGSFHGNDPVTKQQMAAVMLRLAKVNKNEYDWHTVELAAVKHDLMSSGRTSGIHSVNATRADVFDMLYRVLQSKDHSGLTLEQRLYHKK